MVSDYMTLVPIQVLMKVLHCPHDGKYLKLHNPIVVLSRLIDKLAKAIDLVLPSSWV